MKKILLQIFALLAFVSIIAACHKAENIVDSPPINTATTFGNITGTVSNAAGTMMGVAVSVGNLTTYTNEWGAYFLSNVPTGDRILINFKYDKYVFTQKIAAVVAKRTITIDAALTNIFITQNLNASAGGSIQILRDESPV